MESHDAKEGRRRAAAIYNEKILPKLNLDADKGRYVFIDALSGDYEIGGYDDWDAAVKLVTRRPDGSFWAERVGYDTPFILDDMHRRLFNSYNSDAQND